MPLPSQPIQLFDLKVKWKDIFIQQKSDVTSATPGCLIKSIHSCITKMVIMQEIEILKRKNIQ